MGCFNVACSVSNLSINSGDPVVYIPLLPSNWVIRNYPDYKHHLVGKHSGLIYSNCYFNPLTFPIKGKYNDYGGIEEVEKSANTKAIEKYFGIPIEDFVNTVERNWCRSYIDDQKLIGEHFIKEFKEFNNLSDDELSDKFMLKMGFTKDSNGMLYSFEKLPYKVAIISGDKKEGYHIIDSKTGVIVKSREHNGFYKNYLLSDMAELTGYYIGITKEHQEKIHIMENLSGMFIHGDIYDLLSKGLTRSEDYPTEDMLKELGFILDSSKKTDRDGDKFYYHPEVADTKAYLKVRDWGSPQLFDKDTTDNYYGHSLESSIELVENYIEKHGVILDITPYDNESSSLSDFKKIQESIISHKAMFEDSKSPDIKDFIKNSSLIFGHPLSGSNLRQNGLWAFEGWAYLKDIYSEYFEKGSIAKDFCEWVAAKEMMFSANVFFFPAMNGEQHGNDEISKQVLKKALSVIEERERLYKEENSCPDCGQEECVCE